MLAGSCFETSGLDIHNTYSKRIDLSYCNAIVVETLAPPPPLSDYMEDMLHRIDGHASYKFVQFLEHSSVID